MVMETVRALSRKAAVQAAATPKEGELSAAALCEIALLVDTAQQKVRQLGHPVDDAGHIVVQQTWTKFVDGLGLASQQGAAWKKKLDQLKAAVEILADAGKSVEDRKRLLSPLLEAAAIRDLTAHSVWSSTPEHSRNCVETCAVILRATLEKEILSLIAVDKHLSETDVRTLAALNADDADLSHAPLSSDVAPSAKRYRINKKTRDDQTPSGDPSSSLDDSVPPASISLPPRPTLGVSVGKRTMTINQALGSFSRRIHPSHPLGHKRGVVWCWNCGAFAVREPQKLGDPCMPISFSGPVVKSEIYGRACLSRIRRGLTPRSDMTWPDQGEHPFEAPPDLGIINAPPPTVTLSTTVSQSPKAPGRRMRGRAAAP